MNTKVLWHIGLVAVVSSLIMFANLGGSKLWDRDEPRNAGCALEMVQRGDLIVPIFNGELRHQKPVLLYWLIAAAYLVFGVSEFAARFWSAFFAVGTSLATYSIGRRLFGGWTGLVASMILTTSVMFVVAGRAATPDSLLIFCQTIALAIYVGGSSGWVSSSPTETSDAASRGDTRAIRSSGTSFFPGKSWQIWSMYGFMGLGVLAKGLIAIVMPMAIIGLHLLIVRMPQRVRLGSEHYGGCTRFLLGILRPFHPVHFWRTLVSMKPWIAIAAIVSIAGPWFVWVGLRTNGDFLRLFFLQEHLGRATTAFEHHGGGYGYYLVAVSVGCFPWSVFFLPTFLRIDRELTQRRNSAAITFLLCWVGCQIGLFTLISTKLPSYVTPCYPALAILVAVGLRQLSSQSQAIPGGWFRLAAAATGLSAVAIGIGVFLLADQLLHGSYWLLVLSFVWMATAVLSLFLMGINQGRWVVPCYSTAAVAFSVLVFGFATQAVDSTRQTETLFESPLRRGLPAPIASYRCLESSWVFYAGQPIWELAESRSTAAASTVRTRDWEPKPRVEPATFIAEHPGAMLVTTADHWNELCSKLTEPYQIVRTAPYFLRNKELVLAAPVHGADSLRVGQRETKLK